MMKKKGWIRAGAAALAAMMLVSCSELVEPPYQLPQWASAIVEPEQTDVETVEATAKVDVYYDNTQSMYGFATGGTMVRAVAALRDVVNQYKNTTTYTLGGSSGGYLQWMPFTGDIYTSMVD